MTLFLDIEENLPPPIIVALNLSQNVPVHRVGNFYEENTGPGCGTNCIWNGGGYYMDTFVCGETYPSGLTFYCSSDCYRQIGKSKKVFLSYRWCDSEIANKITSSLRGVEIEIIRDINEINFLDAISSFMNTAGESRYFIAVMTESYFYSRFCMYEFYQIAKSDQIIRTIPLMLGTLLDSGIEIKLLDYWNNKHFELARAISGIDQRYTGYLQHELDLLANIPSQIKNFFEMWHAKERPEGGHWLAANCYYMIGAIKTTFKPTEDDATNWTFSNKTIRGERAEDLPPIANWKPRPFYLHAYSETESMTVTNNTQARKLILDVYHDDPTPKILPSGVHLVLINKAALSSLNFCERLQALLNREDIILVPIFLDETLRMPASETDLLRQWYDQLICTSVLAQKEKIDLMLSRFGPMIENLRNTLVPSIERIVAE